MALVDLSFKLYTDAALTTLFTGILQLVHKTDLSDNPQDFVLYFGSVETSRKLQEFTSPGVNQINLTPTDTLPNWVASTAYSVGQYIEPVAPNGLKYKCIDAGTSSGTEPVWPTTGIGSTVVDGGAVWELLGAKHPTTELKLASTLIGLDTAVGGAALDLGVQIDSGVSNAKEVHIRIENTVTTPNDNTGHSEIGVFINNVIESDL